MRHLVSIVILLGIGSASLLAFQPVLAFPSLPSTFYGTVKVNGANVTDGTLVQASIQGKIITEIQTQTYKDDSFYSLDVPADDPDTLAIEGGQEGDTITFIIGGIVADQAGVWKSGTIFSLNLSASSAATFIPAQATLTHAPIQTEIILMIATPTPLATMEAQFAPMNALLTPGSSLLTAGTPPTPLATMEAQFVPMNALLTPGSSLLIAGTPPTPSTPFTSNQENDLAVSSMTNLYIGVVIAGFILIILLFTAFYRYKRKQKVE
jgi:hypothetical protein